MSHIHDLRSYLAALEAKGQLARVHKPVSLKYELADVAAALERSGGPAPLFECPQFYDGHEGFNWPVFSSGLAQRDRVATAFECQPDEVPAVMSRVLEPAAGVPPRRVAEARPGRRMCSPATRSTWRACPSPGTPCMTVALSSPAA